MPSQVIRIKRRLTGAAGAPSALASAELAYNNIDATLYIGAGDNGQGQATSVVAIAGANAVGNFVTLDTNQSISGNKTFSGEVAITGDLNLDAAESVSGLYINQLEDVDIIGEIPPVAGDILTWNGNAWTNSPAPADSIVSVVAAPDSGVYATTAGDVVTIGGINATTTVKGVVRFATQAELDAGASGVAVTPAQVKAEAYELPIASATILGGVKVGGGLTIDGDGVLSANLEGALEFKGSIDVTQPAPSASQGDLYINETAGQADASFTGIANQPVLENALVIYDGSEWNTADLQVDSGVVALTGTDPITVDNTDPKRPIVGVKDGSTTQKGVVQLASAADLAAGSSDKVVTADQVQELTGAVLPVGTSDGAVLTYLQASAQWISQNFLDGGLF
jgi:hypothetical protein